MPIKNYTEKHDVSWLRRLESENRLNKSISIQRKEVWDAQKKSDLIISLLLDIPVESLLFEEGEDGAFNVLDGKQRTLTLCSYLADGFSLSPKIRIKRIGDCDLVGKKYSDLPVEMQNQIKDYELSISILRPLEPDDRATVFYMRNQAVALSKMDLSRVMLGQDSMAALTKLCEHA